MLTDIQLRALPFQDGQKDFPDRDGMFVRVGKTRKTFMCVLRQNGRRSYVTLGHYPSLTISKARGLARQKQAEARLAKDLPVTMTFKAALEIFMTHHIPTMRPSSQVQATRILTKRFAVLHSRRLTDLTTPEVATALDAITAPGEKLNASIYIRAFLAWCFGRGYIDINPIARLKPPPSSVARDRVLSDAELIHVWDASSEGGWGAFIRFLILSAQRKGQAYAFEPSMLDRDNRLLTFPASTMKGARQHIIPVTETMFTLLTNHRFGAWNERWRKIELMKASETTGWRIHDLRRTTATGMAQIGVAPYVIERLLAHAMPGVMGRYNRASYLPELRDALERWESYLSKLLYR